MSNWYKSGRGTSNASTSFKSSEESVNNARHGLEPVVEEEAWSDSTSNMSMNTNASGAPEFAMAFNMRLTFVRANEHGA